MTRSLIYRAVIIAIPTLLSFGCANQHQLVHESSAQIQPEPTQILAEIVVLQVPTAESTAALGPQLIAGDWLAWQCAFAGSYWDMPAKNAPTFAEAFDSDFAD